MHLVTGSAGYVGSTITNALLQDKKEVIGCDLDITYAANNAISLRSEQVDITDYNALEKIFAKYQGIECVYHCAAQLLFKRRQQDYFYKTNIDATKYLVELAIKNKVKNFVSISSNCVYGKINHLGVKENTPLEPFEEYGISKKRSEEILLRYKDKINIVILRSPTIIGEGRLGILSIVFDFIKEHKKLWLVGSGKNRYQFVYGEDLTSACIKASKFNETAIFNIGTENPHSLEQIFTHLVKSAGSRTKIYHLPAIILIPIMKICYRFGISPLGPYQYNMITNTYSGDISLIREKLGWYPTKNNSEILTDAYHYYIKNYDAIHSDSKLSGHRKAGKAGIIKLLKWLS